MQKEKATIRRQEMKIIHQRGQKIFNQRGLQTGNKQTYRQEENIEEEEQKK